MTESFEYRRHGFLPLRESPLGLPHGQIQGAQMQLVMIGMEDHVSAEPERAALLLDHGVELQLVLFVDRLRGHTRKIAAGNRDEGRRGSAWIRACSMSKFGSFTV